MSDPMSEKQFRERSSKVLRSIVDAFDQLDIDLAEAETTGDVVTITYANRSKYVINTQGATQQIWLAGDGQGWHFDYKPSTNSWLHAKGSGDELLTVLKTITHKACGAELKL